MSDAKFPSTTMNPMFRQLVTLLPWATELCYNIVESKDERMAGRRPVASPEQRFRSYLQANGCDVPRFEAAVHGLLEDGASAAALQGVVSTVVAAAASKHDLAQLVNQIADCCVPGRTPRPAPVQRSATSPADAPPGTTWTPGMDPESAWLFSQTLPAPAGAIAPEGYARRGDRFWPLRVQPMASAMPTPAAQDPAPTVPPAAASPTPAPSDPMIGTSTCIDPKPQPSPAEPAPPHRPRTRRFVRKIVVRPSNETPSTSPSATSAGPAPADTSTTTPSTAEPQPVPGGATAAADPPLATIEKWLEKIEGTLSRKLEGLEQKLTESHAKQQKDLARLSERVALLEAQPAARPVPSPTPADTAKDAPAPTPPDRTTASAPTEATSGSPLTAAKPCDPTEKTPIVEGGASAPLTASPCDLAATTPAAEVLTAATVDKPLTDEPPAVLSDISEKTGLAAPLTSSTEETATTPIDADTAAIRQDGDVERTPS